MNNTVLLLETALFTNDFIVNVPLKIVFFIIIIIIFTTSKYYILLFGNCTNKSCYVIFLPCYFFAWIHLLRFMKIVSGGIFILWHMLSFMDASLIKPRRWFNQPYQNMSSLASYWWRTFSSNIKSQTFLKSKTALPVLKLRDLQILVGAWLVPKRI